MIFVLWPVLFIDQFKIKVMDLLVIEQFMIDITK